MRYKAEILSYEEKEALIYYAKEALRIRDINNIALAEFRMLMTDMLDK